MVEFLVARHLLDRLSAVGLPAATRRLAWPGRLVTRTWVTLAAAPCPASCSTGSTWSATWRRRAPDGTPAAGRDRPRPGLPALPGRLPAAGRRYHERSAWIVADEAAQVLVPGGTARDLAELYGVDRGRVTITPLGVEVPLEPDRAGAERSCATWASAGRSCWPSAPWSRARVLPRLLDAFGQVAGELPGHWLVVVGPVGWGPRLRPTWDSVRVKLAGQVGDASCTPSTRPPTASPTRACTRASACPCWRPWPTGSRC